MEDNKNKTAAAVPVENVVDYEKIESIIQKGIQQKESAILKSYFEQQGLTDEELQQAVNDFKANRQNSAAQRETEFSAMETENAQLKEQIRKSNISNAVQKSALEMGVDAKNIPFVLKLAELDSAVSDTGEIDEGAVKSAVEKVLKEIPSFKAENKNNGFVVIGSNKQTADDEKAAEERLKKAFGL